ncbi:MAG TPA: hypothetical protein VGM76_13880 [Lacipirellulaceae bacterium]|jgi:hypothetical protein
MAANFNARSIFGFNLNAQGSARAVRGWQKATLRAIAIEIRGIYLCLGNWYALGSKRMPAAAIAPASCRSIDSTRRHQRHQRWMSGVVVDPGTVGVC